MSLIKYRNRKSEGGFTLVEIVVFILFITVLFVSIVSVYVKFLFTSNYNENKTIASHYAEELSEWLMFQRDISWDSIKNLNGVYCFNDMELKIPISGQCGSFSLGEDKKANYFKREVNFIKRTSTDYIEAIIKVSWDTLNTKNSVSISRILTVPVL